MPIYESACATRDCAEFGVVNEWLARSADSPELDCVSCGKPMERRVSRFGVIWTGPITSRYLQKGMEGENGDGSHWMYRTKGTKSGKPEPVLITTFQEQRDFAKAEGLGLPQDTSPGRISADGRTLIPISEAEARDMREANGRAILAEKKEKAGATTPNGRSV